jgi:hypothetical protein
VSAAAGAADFRLRGTPFVHPAACWGVAADGDRVAGAVLSEGAHRLGDDELRYAVEPGCVDLSRVRSGRCPLLLEHRPFLDALAGVLLDAWLEGPLLACTARVARGGAGDDVWNWIGQGLPLSISMGAAIVEAEPAGPSPYGGTSFRVTRWSLRELSVCVHGKDEHAHLRRLDARENRGWLERKAAGAPEEARRAVHATLHLDKWETWSTGAGLAIAAGLGADPDRVCDLLEEQVRRQVERLQGELAA